MRLTGFVVGFWSFLHAAMLCHGTALGQGIVADHSVGVVPYSEFAGLAPAAVWQRLDGLEFWSVPREAPTGYYASIQATNATTLRQTLHTLIANHRVFPYSHPSVPGDGNHSIDVWDIVALADAHPTDLQRVLDLYHNNTLNRQLKGTSADPRYDREHSWPKSLGFPDQSTANAAYNDGHHLFAAYSRYNSARSNKPYGSGNLDQATEKPTVENMGRGGGRTDDPDSSNYSFPTVWQTWIGRRGDVARAMFYMDVRYEGGQTAAGGSEPQLTLTDDVSQISQRNVWATGGTAYMGIQSVLLNWHGQDSVDDLERRRNTVVYLFQGNRNPFVDHPEWVAIIYGTPTPSTGSPSAPANPTTADVWINELHYDNEDEDTGEFVEVAGTSGVDLGGWSLVGYNGNGGRRYDTVRLSGILPTTPSKFGLLAFEFPGLQNGAPDGVALIDAAGQVREFLGYEGSFTATDGPADDHDASDIGFSESGVTPVGHSLQRRGSGRRGVDFVWSSATAATRAAVNPGQEFKPPS